MRGNAWLWSYTDQSNPDNQSTEIYYMYIDGDTTIFSIEYKKLWRQDVNRQQIGAIREDSTGRVFIRSYPDHGFAENCDSLSEEQLLYDFSYQVDSSYDELCFETRTIRS